MPNVTKGAALRRLLEYLYGPGTANEHTNPHLVAGYDEPTILEPERDAQGRAALAELTDRLALPHVLAGGRGRAEWVWHCSLSVRSDERPIDDAEWRDIADKFVERMGFGAVGERPGCRWIAVHHGLSTAGNNHIHIVVTLAREDGSSVRVDNDFSRSQKLCAELEVEHGLRVDAIRDAGSRRPDLTRGELERAQKAGANVTDREWLRHQVMAAAAAADSEENWVRNLRRAGLMVGVRADANDPERVVGYKVARAPQEGEKPVWYSGRSLDGELSLNRVRRRWPDGIPLSVQQWRDTRHDATQRIEPEAWAPAWRDAATRIEAVASRIGGLDPGGPDVDLVTRASADVMSQVAWIAEPSGGGPVTKSAGSAARAAVPPRRPAAGQPSREAGLLSRELGTVALMLAMTGRSRDQSDLIAIMALVVAATRLVMAIRELREASGRAASAAAAAQAGSHLGPVLAAANRAGVRLNPEGRTPPAASKPSEQPARTRRTTDRERGRGRGDDRGR